MGGRRAHEGAVEPVEVSGNKCAQCKKEYKHAGNGIGCPKCAPGVRVNEVEFRKPIDLQKEVNETD